MHSRRIVNLMVVFQIIFILWHSEAKAGDITQSHFGAMAADEISAKARNISYQEFELILNNFVQQAGWEWKNFVAVRNAEGNPYETGAERLQRIESAKTNMRKNLRRLYEGAATWWFKINVDIAEVNYDADKGEARATLREIPIPYIEGQAANLGLTKGLRHPLLYAKLQPLYRHIFNYETVSQRHFLRGVIIAAVDRDTARQLDIVQRRGRIEAIIRFRGFELVDGVVGFDESLEVPAVELLSAKWTLDSTTFWSTSIGTGLQPTGFTIPGDPRVIGKSPNTIVKYALYSNVNGSEVAQTTRKMRRELGIEIGCRNSRAPWLAADRRTSMLIKCEPDSSEIYVNGEFVGYSPVAVDSLVADFHLVQARFPFHRTSSMQVYTSTSEQKVATLRLAQFTGTWEAYVCGAGMNPTLQGILKIEQIGSQLNIEFRNRRFQTQVGELRHFWNRIGQTSISCIAGDREVSIDASNGCGFELVTSSDPNASYDRFFFLIAEDGSALIGKRFERDSSYLGSKLNPGEVAKANMYCRLRE